MTVDPALEPQTSNEPRVPLRLFVLKHGDTFVVADAFGDIIGVGDGLFHDDTRILSSFRLRRALCRELCLTARVGGGRERGRVMKGDAPRMRGGALSRVGRCPGGRAASLRIGEAGRDEEVARRQRQAWNREGVPHL